MAIEAPAGDSVASLGGTGSVAVVDPWVRLADTPQGVNPLLVSPSTSAEAPDSRGTRSIGSSCIGASTAVEYQLRQYSNRSPGAIPGVSNR